MRTYRVGRDLAADIVIDDETVSRDHADLVEGADGGYYWVDRRSTNGSYRKKGGQWVKFSKEYVDGDEPLRIGRYETTVRALVARAVPLRRRGDPVRADRDEVRPHGPVERGSDGIPRPRQR